MSDEVTIDDLYNSLLSWISNHIGEHIYMKSVVIEYPSLPKVDSSKNEGGPSVDTKPPPKRDTNIMT